MDDDLSVRMKALLAPAPEGAEADIIAPVRAGLRRARGSRRAASLIACAAIAIAGGSVLTFGYGLAARALPALDADSWPVWLPVIACAALVGVLLRELLALAARL